LIEARVSIVDHVKSKLLANVTHINARQRLVVFEAAKLYHERPDPEVVLIDNKTGKNDTVSAKRDVSRPEFGGLDVRRMNHPLIRFHVEGRRRLQVLNI